MGRQRRGQPEDDQPHQVHAPVADAVAHRARPPRPAPRVISPDGTDMSVSEALTQINAVLDEVLGEQEGDLDPDTRWCLTWFDAHGFTEGPYGEAETLASARNASIDALKRSGVLTSGGGRVGLIAPDDLPRAPPSRREPSSTARRRNLGATDRVGSAGSEPHRRWRAR